MKKLGRVVTAHVLFLAGGVAYGQESAEIKQYLVTPEAGPWMICTAAYTGVSAAQIAYDLVQEIRRDYKLPAYLFNRGADERQKQLQEVERIRRLCPEARLRRIRIEEQYAVLIGGYKDIDAARRALDRIKKLEPPKSGPKDTLQVLEPTGEGENKGYIQHVAPVNPFQTSFVVRNPTVPAQPKDEDKTDPFLKELNSGETYSLLKCKQPWTLAVKQYDGAATLVAQQAPTSFLDKLLPNAGAQLSAGAKNAHELARVLREFNFDAYVLHTRTSSIVTVGGFDRSDDPRMDNVRLALSRQKFNPAMDLIPNFPPMQVPRP